MAIIKTPDQRVRVFISSTINELADERMAAREAINNLRLIPVFFEAGARPHPPRDLYSAYLDQSHIFLGIYWNSYGWVAPGAEISGLEDEYRLCGNNKPKLIYVKRSTERQPRLNDLLGDIEKSDSACYQLFSDAQELKKLIENDLSVLISEIFENALLEASQVNLAPIVTQTTPVVQAKVKRVVLPSIKSDLIGRVHDTERIIQLIQTDAIQVLTLLGSGGTGKTTLAIHLGHAVKEFFSDGVLFISLAPITDPNQVSSSIAEVIGIQDGGKQSVEQTLIDYLIDKKLLLILDNFEQVVACSKFISDLVTFCPNLKILVTSRTSLHIRNETIYNLSPLELPPEDLTKFTVNDLEKYAASKLFVERSLQVNPGLLLNKENAEAIFEICRRLDGLPLAIELAAARTRFFQPAALMSRLNKTLDLVSKGQKDLPERQQTLRAAIEWSYNLLTENSQKAFRQLGVFKRSWTLDAADCVLDSAGSGLDIEELTESLLDVSLIRPVLVNQYSEPRFNMLQTVHEYAAEMLDKSSETLETRRRYADYYYQICLAAEGKLWGRHGEVWLDQLEQEHQNIRAAFHFFISDGQMEKAWNIFFILCPFWTIRGGFSETSHWIEDASILGVESGKKMGISDIVIGRTCVWAGYCKLFLFDFENGFRLLNEAAVLLIDIQAERELIYALIFDGCYGSFLQLPQSEEKMQKGLELCLKYNDKLALIMYYCWSCEYFRQKGEVDTVHWNLQLATDIAREEGITYIIGAGFILRFSMTILNPVIDWDQVILDGQEMYALFPEKGYKGLKGAAKSAVAYGYMMKGQFEEAGIVLMEALEYARTSGELESSVYGLMEAAYYFANIDQHSLACKLAGSLDAFIQSSGYPLVGGSEAQYNNMNSALEPWRNEPANKRAYEEGKKLRMLEAVVLAMNSDEI